MIPLLLALAAHAADVPTRARVDKVYDGDTMTLDTGDKLRLRGANAPEIKGGEPYAHEARELTARMAEGEYVDLDVDPTQARDHYGRLVASVRAPSGDLALALIREGYAHAFFIPPVGETAALLEAQRSAQDERLGIWSTDRYRGPLHITSFHANARGDDRSNVNGEYLRVCNVGHAPVDLSSFTIEGSIRGSHALPPVVLPVGYTAEIRSGAGDLRADLSSQVVVYLQSDDPLWEDRGDEATIRDSAGNVVDRAADPPR